MILAALDDEDDGRASVRGGALEARIRRTYRDSDDVQEAEACVLDCNAAERSRGVATEEIATGRVRVTRDRARDADRLRADAAEALTAARSLPSTPPAP